MIIIKDDGSIDRKFKKAKLIGKDSIQDKLDILNNHYKGDITWSLCEDLGISKIYIDELNPKIGVLEIPYFEELSLHSIPVFYLDKNPYNGDFRLKRNNIVTVKLPKELPEIPLGIGSCYWIRNINRLFMWDSTYIDFSKLNIGSDDNLQMIIIQSTKGKKPQFVRYNNK